MRAAAAVVLGGVLYALALPPFDWSVCGWLTLVPLLWAVRGVPTGVGFRYGVLYGYASGWAVTWCFAEAAMHYFALPLPVAVAAVALWYLVVCGLPFGLFAAGAALVLRSRRVPGPSLAIAALWVTSEYLRGRLMGQPWGLLGYTQHAQLPLVQIASVTGVYGVSFVLAFGGAALADVVARIASSRRIGGHELIPVAGVVATVAGCWIAGWLAMAAPSSGVAMRQVAIVQANVAPQLHWSRAYTDAQVAAHVRATDTLGPGPSLIVWPEHSVPRYLEQEPMLAVQLASLARRHRADLLFGGPRYEAGRTYNAARLITASGRNGGHYDKRRLVLFAEEKPLAPAHESGAAESPEQFSEGTGSGVLHSMVPIGVSICHEIVHPDLIRDTVRDGAELLVNIANDGWLDGGYHAAAAQHLAMAVFRAVETRRFLVRAATTGTSAVIDPYGRILAAQATDTAGVVTAGVTGIGTMTPYVRFGDVFAMACALVSLLRLVRLPVVAVRRSDALEAPAVP
jgi:apolipoprotein N-acyltransferase